MTKQSLSEPVSRLFRKDKLFKPVYGTQAIEYIKSSEKLDELLYSDEYDPGDLDEFTPSDYSAGFWSDARDSADDPDELIERMIQESYTDRMTLTPPPKYDKKNDLDNAIDKQYSAFQKDYAHFENKYAASLESYLKGLGRESFEFVGITEGDLGPCAAAGLAYDENSGKAALVGNKRYEQLRNALAKHYGVSNDISAEYIHAHEFVHRYQKGMKLSESEAEKDVENTLIEYFAQRTRDSPSESARYKALERIAKDRRYSVNENYGARSPGKSEHNSLSDVSKHNYGSRLGKQLPYRSFSPPRPAAYCGTGVGNCGKSYPAKV